MARKDKPVIWVVAMAAVLVAAFGWAFMAAGYAHSVEGWRSGGVAEAEFHGRLRVRRGSMQRESVRAMADFVHNAFRQLPKMPAVIGHSVSNRLWLPLLFVVLEGGVIGGGWWMYRLEKELRRPPRRKPRKIATPKFRDDDI